VSEGDYRSSKVSSGANKTFFTGVLLRNSKVYLALGVLALTTILIQLAATPRLTERQKALLEDCQSLVSQRVLGDYVNESERQLAALAEALGKEYNPGLFDGVFEQLQFDDFVYEEGFIRGYYGGQVSGGSWWRNPPGSYSCFVDGSVVTLNDYEYPANILR
jgi:hypothetical protein